VPNLGGLSNNVSMMPAVPIPVSDMTSLIAAINQANANGPDVDIIDLTNDVYTMTSSYDGSNALPVITSAITIYSNGATLQRDSGAPAFRLFNIASQGSLKLMDLTIRQGVSDAGNGGAIYNDGNLELDNTAFVENGANDGGAIYSTGILTINSGSFVGNHSSRGGAIYSSDGALSIDFTGISENTATYGAGIYTLAVTTITNTTLDNNNGGCCSSWGAGIYVNGGSVTISDSIISRNSAYFGPAISSSGNVILSRTQIINNISNIHNYGAITNSAGNLSISDSLLGGNIGGALYNNGGSGTIINSCITRNALTTQDGVEGFVVTSRTGLTATHNWWNSSSGPSGIGSGNGESVGPNIDFSSFATVPLANCPVPETYISGVGESPSSLTVPVNEDLNLSARVYGTGDFSQNAHWSVLSGNGTISSTSDGSVIFTAPPTPDVTAIRLISDANPTNIIDFNVLTVEVGSFAVDPHTPVRVLTNGSVKVFGFLPINSSIETHFPVVWSLTGPGSLGPSESVPLYKIDQYSVTYYAPAVADVPVSLRVSLKYFPNFYADIPIQIVSGGPVSCADVSFPLIGNAAHYTASMGGIEQNWPFATEGNFFAPFDHIPDEIFSVNIRAKVKPTAVDPITNVNITFGTDHAFYGPYPMSLDSGDGFDGYWKWQGSVPDSICYNYYVKIELTNAVHTSTEIITPR
jgi:hypothetical protein